MAEQSRNNRIGRALRRLAAVLLGALCLLGPLPAEAAETGSLTLVYALGDTALPGAAVRLYHVASWDSASGYRLTEDFAASRAALPPANSAEKDTEAMASGWSALARQLETYAAANHVAPFGEGSTDTEGKVVFIGLTFGLYLVTGPAVAGPDGQRYELTPFLVAIPTIDDEGQGRVDVTAQGKLVPQVTPPEGETDYRVQKVWVGDTPADRPAFVTVTLLRDGSPWDTVRLHAANRWAHHWAHLSAAHTWAILEDAVPQGYTVLVAQDGAEVTIYNTAEGKTPPPLTPPTPTPTQSPTPTTKPGLPHTGGTPTPTAKPGLPHTGGTPTPTAKPGLPHTGGSTPTPPPGGGTPGSHPQTGDASRTELWIGLLLVAAGLLALLLRRLKRASETE